MDQHSPFGQHVGMSLLLLCCPNSTGFPLKGESIAARFLSHKNGLIRLCDSIIW